MTDRKIIARLIYSDTNQYASFPQIIRTAEETVLLFQAQELKALRALPDHPHQQKVARPVWAISRDRGQTWDIQSSPPKIGAVIDATYSSAPLIDGGVVILTFWTKTFPKQYALIWQGQAPDYRPAQDPEKTSGQKYSIRALGPFAHFYPHALARISEGTLLACGYAEMPGGATEKTTAVFLKSTDEGKSWWYLSHIPNPHLFGFSEPDLIVGSDGTLRVLLRVDWDYVPQDQRPADGGATAKMYGYYLYQAESRDSGITWSEPVQLPLWGHPPCVKRLASGNILLVFGVRQPPYQIKAVLSRDEGKTWDLSTLKVIHTFGPGSDSTGYPYDIGYPVVTQYPDGSILCAFYGHSTTDLGEKVPHGIFVSLFKETALPGDKSVYGA